MHSETGEIMASYNNKINVPARLDAILTWPVLLYRYCKYGYVFRRIYLGEGKWTILDQEDYYRLRHYKWVAYGRGTSTYAFRFKFVGPNKTTMMPLHSEIMEPKEGMFVDHKNCNSLDNRRANLRYATRTENNRNRRKKKNATSRFLGVSIDKKTGRWISAIAYNKKRMWLGRFDSEVEAAHVYDKAAKKYFGEFARLNFPQEDEKSQPLFTRISKAWTKLKQRQPFCSLVF
jgi:hypothetical protein